MTRDNLPSLYSPADSDIALSSAQGLEVLSQGSVKKGQVYFKVRFSLPGTHSVSFSVSKDNDTASFVSEVSVLHERLSKYSLGSAKSSYRAGETVLISLALFSQSSRPSYEALDSIYLYSSQGQAVQFLRKSLYTYTHHRVMNVPLEFTISQNPMLQTAFSLEISESASNIYRAVQRSADPFSYWKFSMERKAEQLEIQVRSARGDHLVPHSLVQALESNEIQIKVTQAGIYCL